MGTSADATITSKGQVTIPKEIRDRLGLEAGQEVEFELDDGEVTVRPKRSAMERLRRVSDEIQERHGRVDVGEIRRKAKREWASVPENAGRDE